MKTSKGYTHWKQSPSLIIIHSHTHTVMPPGGLTQEQTVGVGVGVSVAVAIIFVLVIVAMIILVVYMRRKRADKYVLNYSTVYGE